MLAQAAGPTAASVGYADGAALVFSTIMAFVRSRYRISLRMALRMAHGRSVASAEGMTPDAPSACRLRDEAAVLTFGVT